MERDQDEDTNFEDLITEYCRWEASLDPITERPLPIQVRHPLFNK